MEQTLKVAPPFSFWEIVCLAQAPCDVILVIIRLGTHTQLFGIVNDYMVLIHVLKGTYTPEI